MRRPSWENNETTNDNITRPSWETGVASNSNVKRPSWETETIQQVQNVAPYGPFKPKEIVPTTQIPLSPKEEFLKKLDEQERDANIDWQDFQAKHPILAATQQAADKFVKKPFDMIRSGIGNALDPTPSERKATSEELDLWHRSRGESTTTGNKVTDTLLSGAGGVIGIVGQPSMGGIGGGGSIGSGLSGLTKGTEYGLTRILPKIMNKPIVGKVLQGAVESLPFSAQQAGVQGMSPQETAKTFGINAGLGGAIGGGIGAFNKLKSNIAAKKLLANDTLKPISQEAVQPFNQVKVSTMRVPKEGIPVETTVNKVSTPMGKKLPNELPQTIKKLSDNLVTVNELKDVGDINILKDKARFLSDKGTLISGIKRKGGGVLLPHEGVLKNYGISPTKAMDDGLVRVTVNGNKKFIGVESKANLTKKQIETLQAYYPDHEVSMEITKLGSSTNGENVIAERFSTPFDIKPLRLPAVEKQFTPSTTIQKESLEGFKSRLALKQGSIDEIRTNDKGELVVFYKNLGKDNTVFVGLDGKIVGAGKIPKENFKPLTELNAPTITSRTLTPSTTIQKGLLPQKGSIQVGEPILSSRTLTPRGLKPQSNINTLGKELKAQNGLKTVGDTPIIPEGLKERGMSANTRTDVNNPDILRDSYTSNPLTYKELGNPTTLAKAQVIFDQGYESARTQLSDLASKMQPEAIPLAKLLSRQATEMGNIQGAREIISDVAERLTQAGQFSQAANILREADPETFLMTIGKQLKKLNKEGLDTYGKKWKAIDLTPNELDMVSKIERGNQASYESAFEQIQTRMANEMPSSVMEKVNAWRHISMLLNPKTQVRNVGGNVIMMGMRRNAKQVSAVLQKVLLKPEDRTQVFKIKGEYKQAATDYFTANKKDLLSGANKYNENISLNMPNKRVFKNNVLESTRNLTYKVLEMGDTPFYKNAYINRLASYAQAKGIKDFSKLGQEAFDIAKKEAEQATYKDASNLAAYLNKVKNPGRNANLGQKAAGAIAEATVPFTKTPINIIKRGIQYSPAGIVNGMHMWKSTGAAAAGIDEMAKGLTGTGIMGLGYLLASKGVLTGKASSDADLKAYDANTGNSPFSILGKYTYDWAQPFSVPLSVGVEVYNALKDNPQDAKKMDNLVANNDTSKLMQIAVGVSSGIYDSLAASGDSVFNMSVMKGIKNLIGNPQGFTAGLAQLPQNYLTQFVPTLSNQIAGVVDPTVRQTYVSGNLPASMVTAVQAKIPFASKLLQPKQTPFGQDVKRAENPISRAFSQFLSPGIIAVNQNIDPKIDTELRRLNKESGLKTQFPTMVPNYIEKTLTHPKIDLTPTEFTQYQKRTGQLTMEGFKSKIDSPNYNVTKATKDKTADEKRADLLAAIIEQSKAQAKKEILKSRGYSK